MDNITFRFLDEDDQDYRSELKIDILDLHNECCTQPIKYVKWAKAFALTDMEKRRIKAKIDRKFRMENLKASESAINAAIHRDEEYILIKTEATLLEGILKAFDSRRRGLDNEVKLFIGKYYSLPGEIKVDSTSNFKNNNMIDRRRAVLNRNKI